LSRFPLAEAVLRLWRWVADPGFLLSVFARHRGQGYEKEMRSGVLVQLIAAALLEQQWEEEFCAGARPRAAHGQCPSGVPEVRADPCGVE
jgi:hypothetical protein